MNAKKCYYDDYCKKFIEISHSLGRPLKTSELNAKNEYSHILPSYRWLVQNCPDKSVKSYNDFLNFLGFKPRYDIPKDYAIKAILKKQKELDRPLMYDDFRNPNGIDEIGISTILKHWGTFNKMLKELNLPLNQEDMTSKQRSVEELKQDIIKLCESIKEKEGRIEIVTLDINECEWCLSRGTYQRYFKKHLGISLTEFIKSIGFIPVKSGMGMIHRFSDGEITTSKHEFEVSTFLRFNGIHYERNVKYNTFIQGYNGHKDCDYVITTNTTKWFVEIAGILDYKKMKKENNIRKRYKKALSEKERMLKENNLNYLIIYPHEISDIGLDEILSPILADGVKKIG